MSEVKKTSTYIDTAAEGSLVIQIAHNLGGTAYPFLYELDNGNKVFISLYDPRIAEFKNLDDDNIQITFSSNWAGYLDVFVFNVKTRSSATQIEELQAKVDELTVLFNQYVTKKTSTLMNNYFDQKLKEQDATDADLQAQIDTLRNDVDSL
jgi:outer membrane murein-binding lipoprotein Lpp